MTTKTRAPKGGITIQGVFYRGGQFLPTDEPQRGAWNKKVKKTGKKQHKQQIAAYKWEVVPDGYRSIYSWVAGTVARPDWANDKTKLVYMGNEQTLNYIGLTETKAKELVEKYNQGELWTKI